jgi:HEAT repeat protein
VETPLPASSREIVEAYRQVVAQEFFPETLDEVHRRATREEFDLGMEYCLSADPLDRVTGTAVLGKLGPRGERAFTSESVQVLIPLLEDADEEVAFGAAQALGCHCSCNPEALRALIAVAVPSPSWRIRWAAVQGLMDRDDPVAIRTLIALTRDPDDSVRDWAVFSLAFDYEFLKTPEIEAALEAALEDSDEEVRKEARLGLERRRGLPSETEARPAK